MIASSSKRIIPVLLWSLVIVAGAYFVFKYIPHYFIFTEQSYTTYLWPRHNWLFLHVMCGLVATVIGPFHFIQQIRKKNIGVHRLLGRIYLISILFGAPAGFYMALISQVNYVYTVGLCGLAFVWFFTSLMAYISIRRHNTLLHREWMLRSYVVTFAFTLFRLGDEGLQALHVGPDDMRATLLSWACWSIPLFITEMVLLFRKLFKSKVVIV
ncbi:MAG: DUF2306 domain-containing protein [Bacteroidota bacterium]